MIISERNTQLGEIVKKMKARKKNIFRVAILLLFIVLLIGSLFISKKLRGKGYDGLFDFTSTVLKNYWKGMESKPETVSIEIKEKDYKLLEKNREQALKRGVIINDLDGDYLPATFEYNGKKTKVKLRLKGHMTDHLQDNKWSFRIKLKDEESFMGMKRFSIQHPGTRGYIYEWIYHELMRKEDVIALRYKFINVIVNGRDWGIYAVEENFDDELIENNKRLPGPILRFDPDLYWVNRYNMMTGSASNDEFASYYSARPEAYNEKKILKSKSQKEYYKKALNLMEGLREKKIRVDQAFDIERLAKFHAIVDLVGGVHSIDWSDIKYYYNPATGKLEPVAYESFTDLTSHDLSALYKYVEPDSCHNYIDWHTMIFSNPVFFREYIKQLNRISGADYLDRFFAESNLDLNNNLAIIYKEFPYKKFEANDYYKRAKMIQKIVQPPKAIHAYFKKAEKGKIWLEVGVLDALPVEIKSVSIHKAQLLCDNKYILASKRANDYVVYKDIIAGFPPDFEWSDSLVDSVIISYSILGSEEIMKERVKPLSHMDNVLTDKLISEEVNVNKFGFILHSSNNNSYYIKPGKITLDENLIIPAGKILFINSGTTLDVIKGAKIISYSPVMISGTEETPVIITSSDASFAGIHIKNASQSVIKNAVFKNLPELKEAQSSNLGALNFYESPVEFVNCNFLGCKANNVISIIRSNYTFSGCLFKDMTKSGLNIYFSDGAIRNCSFEQCKGNVIELNFGKLNVNSLYIDGTEKKAVQIKDGSQLAGTDIKIEHANIAILAEDFTLVNLQNVNITASSIGIAANASSKGAPDIKAERVMFSGVKTNYIKDHKSGLMINGNKMEDSAENIKAIIKSVEKKNK